MRVRILREFKWAEDGIRVRELKVGEVVEVRGEIGKIWCEDGRAEEDKMIDRVPEMREVKVSDLRVNIKGKVKRGKKGGV